MAKMGQISAENWANTGWDLENRAKMEMRTGWAVPKRDRKGTENGDQIQAENGDRGYRKLGETGAKLGVAGGMVGKGGPWDGPKDGRIWAEKGKRL